MFIAPSVRYTHASGKHEPENAKCSTSKMAKRRQWSPLLEANVGHPTKRRSRRFFRVLLWVLLVLIVGALAYALMQV